ncbi:glycosyltransferase [Candidatus Uhrbacteria bacterium]|nr:glycosyltransferase [Candidatus Uhrbacteria bacterium]MBD3284030.1 glycosyltransferase [Candidatus Uhrbacteria bacterium]
MMTVVMVGHKGVPSRSGGIERHVEELSAALAMRGLRVISFDRKWYVEDESPIRGVIRRWSFGIRTKHLDAITHTLSAIFLSLRERPNIIHIHGVGPALLSPIARLLHPRARVVVTFHCVDRTHAKWGWFARKMLWIGEAFSCFFAHRTITVSDGLARYCLDTYECQSSVIPNGVRVERGTDPVHLEPFGLKSKQYLAMVTRLIPHKNIHVAMEAHQLLASRRPELAEAYPLVIVGGSAFTNEYEHELQTFVKDYPHVVMTGSQFNESLRALQEHAGVHLSVSSSEGMSISLLESMAMARPVIVSDIPENTEVVEGDAYVVRTNDAQALSHALESMLDLEAVERDAMGERLRKRVEAKHDWYRIADQTCEIYHEVLPPKRVLRYAA